jgi:hypothetical protein
MKGKSKSKKRYETPKIELMSNVSKLANKITAITG